MRCALLLFVQVQFFFCLGACCPISSVVVPSSRLFFVCCLIRYSLGAAVFETVFVWRNGTRARLRNNLSRNFSLTDIIYSGTGALGGGNCYHATCCRLCCRRAQRALTHPMWVYVYARYYYIVMYSSIRRIVQSAGACGRVVPDRFTIASHSRVRCSHSAVVSRASHSQHISRLS